MRKTYTLTKDKVTKGTYRFQDEDAFGSGRPISIYVPRSLIESNIETITVEITWGKKKKEAK